MKGHQLTNCCRVPFMNNICGACNQPCESVFRADPLEAETPEPLISYDYPEVVLPVYPPRWNPNTDDEFDFRYHSNEEL